MGYFDEKFKKGFLTTVISGVAIIGVVWLCSSFYNGYESPVAKNQYQSLNSKDSAKTIQMIVMDLKLNSVIKNQVELEAKMEKGFDEIKQQLREINRNTK